MPVFARLLNERNTKPAVLGYAMKTIKIVAAILLFTVIVCASAGTWLWTYRPGVDQYAAHRYAAPASATALSATWFGVTSVLLSDGEHSIFIDPFFTRPEAC